MDYAKNGNPVDIRGGNLPKVLIKFKPDWHKAEVTGARELDYYVSDRALGSLFREIQLDDPDKPIEGLPTECEGGPPPLQDPISQAIAPLVRRALKAADGAAAGAGGPPDAEVDADAENGLAEELHAHYLREMRYICITHTLIDSPDVRLKEEEVVLGTILAFCTQARWRQNRAYRMRLHAEGLVEDVRFRIEQSDGPPTKEQLRAGLPRAWAAWVWAQHHRELEFIDSFALLMLGIIFDCLKRLGGLPEV